MTRQPLLYILVSTACFGISPPIAKILVADIPPLVLARLLMEAILMKQEPRDVIRAGWGSGA